MLSGQSYADDYYGWRSFQNSKFNGEITSIEIYNGTIYAGGKFSSVNGDTIRGIAKWVNDHWESMGGEVNAEVYAMTIWNGSLIAAGKFNSINGVSAKNIARWNGTTWQALGNGLNDQVNALTVYSGNLAAGGKFTTSGSTNVKRTGIWNGSSWSEAGNGLSNEVHALIVKSSKLIAGGKFSGKVHQLNGSNWQKLGDGLDDDVYALAVYSNKLIAGGKFNKHISYFDDGDVDDEWKTLGAGVENDVNTLATIDNKLVVGGKFRYAGTLSSGNYVNRIAEWDGSNWGKYATGMSGNVNAIKQFDSVMIAGGNFNYAGGDTAYSIAMWKSIPYRIISGSVRYKNNNDPVLNGKVYAAKLDKYTKKIVYLDSADVGSTGHQSGEYILDRVPEGEGDLLICFPEDEDDNPSGFSDLFVPSYYPESISWKTATILNLYQSHTDINIRVDRIAIPDNPVTGNLTGEANLNYTPEGYPSTSGFDFKAGTIIYMKKNDSFFAYGISDNDEEFSIDSLETGDYTLIADRLGYDGKIMQLVVTQNTNISITLDTISIITSISNGSEVPSQYILYQNYPNPFNPSSTIRFDIPENSNVKLRIFDMLGREVHTMVNEYMAAGSYQAVWNASRYPSGVYFYSLEAEGFIQTKRMVLVK
jgi:hypothetical protein